MENDKHDNAQRFVNMVLSRCREDKAFAAKLRRADNPDTEDQSWGVLVGLGVDIEKDAVYLPHALVGAALARIKTNADGTLPLGQALWRCFNDQEGTLGEARLRRLLACGSLTEAVGVLRPLLRLMAARQIPLAYGRLLQELLHFNQRQHAILRRWAAGFYYTAKAAEPGPEAAQSALAADIAPEG